MRLLFVVVLNLFLLSNLSYAKGVSALIQPKDLSTGTTILEITTSDKPINAHIPNAYVSNFFKDGWSKDYPPLLNMLPPEKEFSKTLSKFGLEKNKHIVLVAAHNDLTSHAATARIFWSLRMYGYKDISILDGGLAAYINADLKTSPSPSQPTFKAVTAKQLKSKWLAGYDSVYAGSNYNTPVIDSRDFGRATGSDQTRHPLALRYGKIHEAVIVPSDLHFNKENWTYKSQKDIRILYDDVWGKPAGPIVFYSDTGLRAAIAWFAAHEIAKEKDVRLYDGSYLEWDHLGHEVLDETDDMGGPIG